MALTITEVMYNPAGADESLEYVEIYNETKDPIDLMGFQFTRGIDFAFTERRFLDGQEYLVVCRDERHIREIYGISNVVGNWNPETALANEGETLEISNRQGAVQARLRYNDRGQWPVGADGAGHSLEIRDPNRDPGDPTNWAISRVVGGSPGLPNDPAPGDIPVWINEGFFWGDAGSRWIELYNQSENELDLSGYFLTTNPSDLTLAQLPGKPVIAPRGYLSFTGEELGLDFTLPEGEKLFVALVHPGGDRVVDAFNFRPEVEGMSEARIPDGGSRFQDAADPTPSMANATSASDAIVINEIFYHPFNKNFEKHPEREFIELYNRGAEPVDVSGWQFDDGVRYTLPAGTVMGPDSYLVIAFDPQTIRDIYGLPAGQVLGPQGDEAREAFGVLADDGERLTLVDQLGRPVDTVRYYDGGDWSLWADGEGSSLELIDAWQDNSFAQAWDASDDSEKAEVGEFSYLGTFNRSGEEELHLHLVGAGITLVDDISMNPSVTTLEVLTTFVEFGDTWRFFRGTEEPPARWKELDFDDSGWETGVAPVGFNRNWTGGTLLEGMEDNYASVYFRKDVTIDTLEDVSTLVVDVDFDDGFVLYVNGVELTAANMDDGRAFDSFASSSARDPIQVAFDDIASTPFQAGSNVIALQVHNRAISSADFFVDVRLVDGKFVTELRENLLLDGDFEADNSRTTPRWPSQDTNSFWVFEGTHVRSGVTREDPLNGTGSMKIVATGKGDNKVNRIETSNSGLTGLEPQGEYLVSFKAKWVVGSPSVLTHGSYNTPAAAPNYAASHLLPIPENLGTPGAVNSVTLRQKERDGVGNLGPVITGVTQDPAVPIAGQSVTVRARVSDSDGVLRVELHYTLEVPRALDDPGTATIAMVGPDADGVYEGVIPAQPLDASVLFWITASDQEGNQGRYPTDPLERTHPFILDPANATANDQDYLVYRHDTLNDSPRNLSYKFWMHEVNETVLRQRRLLSNDSVAGSFVVENSEIFHHSTIRFSGSPWARAQFSSYRTRLPKDHKMWGRFRKFNLEDGQFAGRRNAFDRISNYLFRNIGTFYGEGWTATMKLNDRARDPLREHLQGPSREYLGKWFPGDDFGPFFEMDDRFTINDAGSRTASAEAKLHYPPYGPAEHGADREYYRFFYNPRGGNPFDDFTDLFELAKVADPGETDDATFDKVIWETADVENFMKVFAIRLNTDDWDSWGAERGKNEYLYRPKIDGLWRLLPWDMELTYEDRRAFMPPTLSADSNPLYRPGAGFAEVTRWINRPDIKRLFYGILANMVDDGAPFTRAFLEPFTDRLREQTGLSPGTALSFVESRAASLRSATRQVTGEFVDFAVDSPEGILTANPVVVSGRAPVEVKTILVLINGEPPAVDAEAHFSKEEVLGWHYETTLSEGTHTLTFLAFDFDEIEVGNISLDVTVTPPPSGLFRRGDDNGDGRVNLSDAVFNLQILFFGKPSRCLDAHDTDDSGVVDIADPTFLLTHLYLGGPPLPAPGKDACGPDPTPDRDGVDLGCEVPPDGC